MIETMTPQEAAVELRERGMRTSPEIIRAGIEQRVFPFGDCITTDKGARYYIYRELFEQWTKEREVKS